MESTRGSDLAALADGGRMLAHSPGAALAMLVAGTLLAGVGPLLQRWTGRSDDPSYLILGMVGMLPWELYFLPRFLAGVDARERNHPSNPAAEWRARFEARWLRTLLAKAGLNLAVGLGLIALVLPGLLVLFSFGWAPLRVLLRGETIGVAMRGSLAMMRQAWRRAMLMVCAAFLVALIAILGLSAAAAALPPGSGPLPLGSPFRWILEALSMSVNLWLSATLLAAFHRLEDYGDSSPSK